MFSDIDTPVERIAYKHNAAQSDDCPNQHGVLRHLGGQMGPQSISPRLAMLRHLSGQTGLHGISPGLGGETLAVLQVKCSTPTLCPDREILPVTRVTAKAHPPQ
jgi:hypothetical protein